MLERSTRINGHRSLRAAASLLSGGIGGRRLLILIYHRVLRDPDPIIADEMYASRFEWHMRLIAESFRPLPLLEAVERLRSDELPPRAACVTFDDGYADNVEVGLPILQQYDIPATFFVAAGFIDGGRMWNDTVIEAVRAAPDGTFDLQSSGLGTYQLADPASRADVIRHLLGRLKYLPQRERDLLAGELERRATRRLPGNLMMTGDQLRTLTNAGMSIGAHTLHHPILCKLDETEARHEISESKRRLEAISGAPVQLFAYPNGKPDIDYTERDVDLVRALGFRAAVSTRWGTASRRSDVWQLPRFTPWDATPTRFMLRLLQNYVRR